MIPGLQLNSFACPTSPDAIATLSVQLAGGHGPVEFRVLRDNLGEAYGNPVPMVPGNVRMDTGSGDLNPIVTSFTFIQNGTGLDGGLVWAQWRSPSGAQQTLRKATLVVEWARTTGACD